MGKEGTKMQWRGFVNQLNFHKKTSEKVDILDTEIL